MSGTEQVGTTRRLRMGSGLSTSGDTSWAVAQACEGAKGPLSGDADLALVFFNPQHVGNAETIVQDVRKRLGAGVVAGISTCAAIGGSSEVERGPGLSVLAASMPGVTIKTFLPGDLPVCPDPADAVHEWSEPLGVTDDLRMTLLLVDPTSVPIMQLLPSFNAAIGTPRNAQAARNHRASSPKLFGGLASASLKSGGNALILNDTVYQHGFVGLSLRGNVHVDTVVSQGCRPVGPAMIVTRARHNMIFELSGKPALEAIQESLEDLGPQREESLRGGLYFGIVIDEYKPRFGRDDFLIRSVVGVDAEKGCVAVADFPRVGQTVRLHVRDKRTASEDLSLLLDAQKLYDQPAGGLLVSCNGRGERLFGVRNHDAMAVQKAFSPVRSGEDVATGGIYVEPGSQGPIPLAGFHAAGEIGPVGGTAFLHAQTAGLALFRSAAPGT